MIHIFNRKEVYLGLSLLDFNEACNKLHVNKIKYQYKIVNRSTSSIFDTNRSRLGSFGENPNVINQYYIYVHKNDYEQAVAVLK